MNRIVSIIFALFALVQYPAFAQTPQSPQGGTGVSERRDSLTISLLTCTPGDKIWSEYGHTALRVKGLQGQDVVFNYGTFDFSKSFFVLRFIFGLTDYKCEAMPFSYFMADFGGKGMGVTEQVFNLTDEEKQAIVQALLVNVQPENQVYRYNFFYDNCATRPRDIVLANLEGGEWKEESGAGTASQNSTPTVKDITFKDKNANPKVGNVNLKVQTYRGLIHERNEQSRWNRYGEDLLLGVGADREVTQEEAEFLPDILMADFDNMTIGDKPLVSEKRELLAPTLQAESTGWLTPSVMSCALLAVSLLAAWWERRRKCLLRWLDLLFLLAAGAVGVILTMMLFSQHPTVRVNLLLLVFNPLPFAMFCVTLYNMVRARGNISRRWWLAWAVLIVMGAVGGVFQHYPEGMWALALCLLVRCSSNLVRSKENR